MLLLQEAAVHATSAAAGQAGESFAAFAPWLILALPLLGFVLNGLLSITAARRALPALPPVGDPHWDAHHEPSEQEHHAHGDDAHPAAHADDHGAHGHDAHGHGPKPATHTLPSFIAPGVLIAAFAVAVVNFLRMLAAHPETAWVHEYWSWMPVNDPTGALRVGAAIQLDQLSMLMTLVITGVGSLIHVFSVGYMKEDPGYPRYMAYLNLFVFFMLTLVLGASYPLMFVGWEGVGLCSYLLIGFWFKERANADAGKKAFIVNRIGDFGFLIAMFLLFANLGTLNFAEVMERAPAQMAFGGAVVTAVCLFFFLGAAGKSAQIPLYVWLPDAMAGPTPVSALIHAATMVTAGVYLVARSATLFTMAPVASLVVALVGTATAIFAASIGLKQWDIKKILAYSTVSQLGFMFAAVGMGAYVAGVFHLMTHAFFKACLFLGSGAVIHAMHEALHHTHSDMDAQDVRNMGGLRRYLPVTFWTMGIATLAIAGVPPFAGFFSKDEITGAAWDGAHGQLPLAAGLAKVGIDGTLWFGLIWGALSIAAFMTAFYMGRMMIYTFFGQNRTGEEERKHLHEGSWTLTLPLVVLALASTFGGFLNVEREVPIVRWFDFGQGEALHRWLHPVLAGADQVAEANGIAGAAVEPSAVPIAVAILLGLGGLALAWTMLSRRALRTAAEEPAYANGVERVLYHKYYVDELYDRVVVRTVGWLSRLQAGFDRYVVDGLVDFGGKMSEWLGVALGRFQTGQVNTYAFAILIGVTLVLYAFVHT
ncbi:MAG: proton-translocating NADH-quinone oxidoreductase, chain [Gemmatimonadetes bacterium]|nr:proton-translocating NADH-quinone oxidoreductase, chain [Gemmatimonadota bacterium]